MIKSNNNPDTTRLQGFPFLVNDYKTTTVHLLFSGVGLDYISIANTPSNKVIDSNCLRAIQFTADGISGVTYMTYIVAVVSGTFNTTEQLRVKKFNLFTIFVYRIVSKLSQLQQTKIQKLFSSELRFVLIGSTLVRYDQLWL